MHRDKPLLVGWNRSPYARRCAITMHVYGIEFDQAHVNAWDAFDEVRAANPISKVPALVIETGDVIIESAAILDYLDCRVGPDQSLTPPPGPLRDRCRRITAVAQALIDKGRELRYEVHLRPPETRYEPFVERWTGQLTDALGALDRMLGTPFAAGERLTQADITAGVLVTMYRINFPTLIEDGRYPALEALAARTHSMPAFQAAALEDMTGVASKATPRADAKGI
ncbi:MAG: glutathione S-transferase family protein [Pseudomonadota bacterium]